MADLPSGSTIGGEKIIHAGNASKHRHHASDIQGLNPLYYGDEGSGGGIDAHLLSGKTYQMLSDEFLGATNDSIDSLVLASQPVNGDDVASLLYLKDSIPSSLRNGEFYGITSIGSQEQETFAYSILDNYTVRINTMDVLINGKKHTLDTKNVDVRNLSSNFQNKSFYFYLFVASYGIDVYLFENKVNNSDVMIYIGVAETDATEITSFTPIENEERIGIGRYMLSTTPDVYKIVVSEESGLVNNGWVLGAKGETIVNLMGTTTTRSGEEHTYTISNYDSFSSYSVSVSAGATVIAMADEDITVASPNTVPFDSTMDVTITRNGVESTFNVNLVADLPTTLSGPSLLQTGGQVYTYTIGNYNPNYIYTVTSTDTTASISGDTVTIITPPTLPNDVSGSFTVEREGSSVTFNYDISAVPPFEVTGREEIWPGGTFNYTIDPYDPQATYNITVPLSYSRNGGIISVTVPSGTSTEYPTPLTVESNGASVTVPVVVLGDPDPIHIHNESGLPLDLYEYLGYPEPALHYTFYLTGSCVLKSDSIKPAALSTGGTMIYGGTFRNGSRITIHIEDMLIASTGGRGGSLSSYDGGPGGTCIEIDTPTTIYFTKNNKVIAGGGGGGSSGRIEYTSNSGGKGGGNSRIMSFGPGGGGECGASLDSSPVTPPIGNINATPATEGTYISPGDGGTARATEVETRYDSNNNPYEVTHTFQHFGGGGGYLAKNGGSSSGSANVDTVSYNVATSAISSGTRSGGFGAGGAAGIAIKGNGKLLAHHIINTTTITGNIT